MPPKYPNVTVKLTGKNANDIITAVGRALKEEVGVSESTAWTHAAYEVRSSARLRRLAQDWVEVE